MNLNIVVSDSTDKKNDLSFLKGHCVSIKSLKWHNIEAYKPKCVNSNYILYAVNSLRLICPHIHHDNHLFNSINQLLFGSLQGNLTLLQFKLHCSCTTLPCRPQISVKFGLSWFVIFYQMITEFIAIFTFHYV